MNNIVVYRLTLSIGILVLALTMAAQKPNIDLIPSSHKVLPTEAIIDTSLVLDSMIQNTYFQDPDFQEKLSSGEHGKKERRQIGPSIDSLLKRPESKKAVSQRSTGKLSRYIRQFNPIRFFIRISAIK